MYQEMEKWIDSLQLQTVSEEIAAFCFNLYDGCDDENWSMELIGAPSFDEENEDWACDEVSDFDSRNPVFKWKKNARWEEIHADMVALLGKYLEEGKFAQILKSKTAVAVGFVDGDLEILFHK